MSYATAYRLRQLPNGHIAREALHLKPAPTPGGDFTAEDEEDAEPQMMVRQRT